MLRRILTTSLFFVLALGTAWAADVTLQTDDGVKLHAVYNPVKSATRGVVLVHMAGRSAEDWAFIATKLNQSGVATLAVDLRGHGGNVSPTSSPTTLTEADYQKMQKDVAAAVAHLRKQGVTDVSLMGASIGANLCLQVAAADPNIKSVVMLSPGMNFKGVMLSEALTTYGDRSLLVVAAIDDSYSAKTAQYIQDAARSRQAVFGRCPSLCVSQACLDGATIHKTAPSANFTTASTSLLRLARVCSRTHAIRPQARPASSSWHWRNCSGAATRCCCTCRSTPNRGTCSMRDAWRCCARERCSST